MPVQKVDKGYRWGEHGKVYPFYELARKQGIAIKLSQARRRPSNHIRKYKSGKIKLINPHIMRISKSKK